MDIEETAFQTLLDLPKILSGDFTRVIGGEFPELSPIELLVASGEIREAVHNATMRLLRIVQMERGELPQ